MKFKNWKYGIVTAFAVAIGMALAAPPALAHTDVGKAAPKIAELQKDYAIGFNLATIPALEGVALHAIAGQTLAIQDAVPAVVAESASPMAIVNQEACAAKEVDIAQKAGGDASALKIV